MSSSRRPPSRPSLARCPACRHRSFMLRPTPDICRRSCSKSMSRNTPGRKRCG
nr:MAG TPA: hypothetical protein [Caudoviricetes sp.]